MSDIVDRLRDGLPFDGTEPLVNDADELMFDAADEIDRLRARVAELHKWHVNACDRANSLAGELLTLLGPCTSSSCPRCDRTRRRQGETWLIGKPCDACNGAGVDYLGRACSHRNP